MHFLFKPVQCQTSEEDGDGTSHKNKYTYLHTTQDTLRKKMQGKILCLNITNKATYTNMNKKCYKNGELEMQSKPKEKREISA